MERLETPKRQDNMARGKCDSSKPAFMGSFSPKRDWQNTSGGICDKLDDNTAVRSKEEIYLQGTHKFNTRLVLGK